MQISIPWEQQNGFVRMNYYCPRGRSSGSTLFPFVWPLSELRGAALQFLCNDDYELFDTLYSVVVLYLVRRVAKTELKIAC